MSPQAEYDYGGEGSEASKALPYFGETLDFGELGVSNDLLLGWV